MNDIEHSKSQVGKINYLPHREVIEEERSTTKIRVVYDGSAKLKNSVSLNNCLYKGPSLVPLLYDVLLRFRIFPIAITADIVRAFLNISIAEEDRDSLLFSWLENHEDKNSEINVFRFARLPFGLNCSPFLLQGTLEHHLKEHEQIDPELICKILKGFYVDDLNSRSSSVEEVYELFEKVKGLTLQAGMNMNKWRTNSPELMRMIKQKETVVSPEPVLIRDDQTCDTNLDNSRVERESETTGKILGTMWDSNKDTLTIHFKEMLSLQELLGIPFLTKRVLLSSIAKVLDPMGLNSPGIILMKILFQNLCKNGIDWDDPVDSGT